MNEITIASTNVTVKEYQGQRVVTFKDIDTVHQRPDGTARRNFNTNKRHFIEGEDYFVRNSYEAKNEFNMVAPNGLVLVTESGYLMLVKSFTDDLSWDVQRELVKSYFRVKEQKSVQTTATLQLPYTYIEKTFHARPVMTANDISNIFGVNPITLYNLIKNRLLPDRDYNLLQGEMLKEYTKENPDLPRCRKSIFVIYNTGLSRIISYFTLDGSKIPKFMTERKGYVVQANVRQLMEYVRRELKGVEALTYLIESDETPRNLETYRKILVQKLSAIQWWKTDVAGIRLGVHNVDLTELKAIHNGEIGMSY